MYKFECYIFFCLILSMSVALLADDVSKSKDDTISVLKRSYQERGKVKQLHAIVRTTYYEGSDTVSNRLYEFIYDGDKKRFYYDLPLRSEEYNTCFENNKETYAVLSIDKDVTYSLKNTPPNVKVNIKASDSLSIITFTERNSSISSHYKTDFPQFNYFGYDPNTILTYRYLDFSEIFDGLATIVQRESVNTVVRDTQYMSLPVSEFKMEYISGDLQFSTLILLDKTKDLYPIFSEKSVSKTGSDSNTSPSSLSIESITVMPELHPDSNLWCAKHWEYTKIRKGVLISKEVADVELISLNKPIDPTLFTLKGWNRLKPDTSVMWFAKSPPAPHKGSLVWDGERIVEKKAERRDELLDKTNFLPDTSRAFGNKILCFNFVVIFILLTIYFYRRYRNARREEK